MQSKVVIGILTKAPKEKRDSSKTTFINVSYCQWLESFGAKVIPIPYDMPLPLIEEILPQINGLLIQGSRCRIKWPYKEEEIQKVLQDHNHLPIEVVLEHIMKILLNSKTSKTPIYLVCWGMELLPLILTGKVREDILKKSTGCRRVYLPCHKIVKDSQLFRYFTEEELEIMEKEKVTYHNHANNITPDFFEENEILKRDCIVTSRGFDGSGTEFVSTFESREFPLVAVQHHPEKIGTILHDISEQCLKVNRKFGEAFVSLCKENQNILLDEKWLLNPEKLDTNPFYSVRIDVIEGVTFYSFTVKEENKGENNETTTATVTMV